MERRIEEHLDEYLSSYIDGALDENARQRVEEYLQIHPEAGAMLEQLKRQTALLKSKQPLVPNDWFWTNFSLRMDREQAAGREVLPFPRKYVPHALAATFAAVTLISVVLYQQRDNLQQYMASKRAEVEHAYKDGILKGNIFPFFTKVDKNEALQFAVFGTLPMDEKSGTSLRIDEHNGAGYRIEVAKAGVQRLRPITVAQLFTAVGATSQQKETVDSMLIVACEKIQSSVLVGDNHAIAIHMELPKLSRVLMSSIAATLGKTQRVKFKQFLDDCNAPYTIMASQSAPPQVSSERLLTEMRRAPQTDRFYVIDPDSAVVSNVRINMDSLRGMLVTARQQLEQTRERANVAIREFAVRSRRRTPQTVRFMEDDNHISIQVSGTPETAADDASIFFRLVPRIPRSAEGGRLPTFVPDVDMNRSQVASQKRIEMNPQVKNILPAPGGPVSLDSLLNDARKSVPQREGRRTVKENAIEL
jgi:hypothetical protein